MNQFFKEVSNPIEDRLVTKTKEVPGEVVNLTITSMIGQVVYKETSLEEDLEENLSFLPNGVYYVTLRKNDLKGY